MIPVPLPYAASPVSGTLTVPGSKSETNRSLVLAALADGPGRVRGALVSRDTDLMVAALATLGTGVNADSQGLRITPPLSRFRGGGTVECGLAGTVMRFVPPVAMLADSATSFSGDPAASRRPMRPLLSALRQLGARVEGEALPFHVSPADELGHAVTIDSSLSSQFLSGLLMLGARLPHGLVMRHVGTRLPSRPHIDMTTRMLQARGVDVGEPDAYTWSIAPGPIAATDTVIEPDLTNAAVFLAAAAVSGGQVTIPGWPRESVQPGALFLHIVEHMGAVVDRDEEHVSVSSTGDLTGVDIDLTTASELTPVVAALGALAEGTTTIRGVAHIRGHETDRIAALVTQLRRAGLEAEELPDGLRILGGTPRPTVLETYADHRMVHFAALLALRVPGVEVDDLQCVSKTMPLFEQDWVRLVTS